MSLAPRNEQVSVKQYTSEGENGIIFSVELAHQGLQEHKVFSSEDHPLLVTKIREQLELWEQQWLNPHTSPLPMEEMRPMGRDEVSTVGERAVPQVKIQEPKAMTQVSQAMLNQINKMLPMALRQDFNIHWDAVWKATRDAFKGSTEVSQRPPTRPMEPHQSTHPVEPDFRDNEFQPKLSVVDKAIGAFKSKKNGKAYSKFQKAYKAWRQQCEAMDKDYQAGKERYADELKSWEKDMADWQAAQDEFHHEEQEALAKVDLMKQDYERKEVAAVLAYCKMVLEKVNYPPGFPKEFELEYNRHDQTLILEHAMPAAQGIFSQHEVGGSTNDNDADILYLHDQQLAVAYDTALYSMALHLLYALFQSDQADAIRAIEFNAWIASDDPADGQQEKECVLSIHVTKEAFRQTELTGESPKAFFEQLGGITYDQLMAIAHERDKFHHLNAMPWGAFEELVAWVFTQEFNIKGEEVKIKHSSPESGVEAIIFDPDPIRGGKIIIRAYRAAQAPGASSVRDLLEQVIAEGAMKGILISNSSFAQEALAFAKHKPLALLNGTDLLNLLEKHRYSFSIDYHETDSIS